MVLRCLSLRAVSTSARVRYAAASAILTGRLIDPVRLSRLERVIFSTPTPQP